MKEPLLRLTKSALWVCLYDIPALVVSGAVPPQ